MGAATELKSRNAWEHRFFTHMCLHLRLLCLFFAAFSLYAP